MRRTKERLEHAAIGLFARYGIAGVSVRAILKEAGQQNGASLHYHFRSKEGLVSALIQSVSCAVDERRAKMLDALEAGGGPTEMRDLVAILVRSTIADGDDGLISLYNRFSSTVRAQSPDLLDSQAQGDRPGYKRVMNHIFRLAKDQPRGQLHQQIIFMLLYLETALAAREIALHDCGPGRSLWEAFITVENLVDSALGIVSYHGANSVGILPFTGWTR